MKPVRPGQGATWRVVPGAGDTAAAIGNTGVRVVSTPALIGWLEQASHLAIEPAFEPGEVSLGTVVDVEHLAPALPGREVLAEATVSAVDGRRVEFKVTARQDERTIVRGRHVRVVVELDRFLARQGLTPPAPRRLVFWFDFHSPWCYLASHRLGDFARRNALAVEWRPLHLPRLIEAIDGRRPLEENAAFVRWYRQDLEDWAALMGLRLRYHPQYPLRPARALRASVHAAAEGRAEPFVRRVMRAYWSEGADISNVAVLGELGAEAGLDAGRVEAAAGEPGCKRAVECNTEEAIAAGVFGVPSFLLDGKLYFGNDRLEMLERHLYEAAR